MVYFPKLPARLLGLVLETLQGDGQEPLPGLEKGQVIEAKVLKLLSENRATLLVMGNKINVGTTVPLKTGDVVNLQVSGEGKKLVLRFVDDLLDGKSQPSSEKMPMAFERSQTGSGKPLPSQGNSLASQGNSVSSHGKHLPSFEKSLVAFKFSEPPPPGDDPLPPLARDQVVDAKVMKLLPENRATLLVQGRKITVDSPIPLKEGETLKLQVAGTGAKQALHLVDDAPPLSLERPAAALKIIKSEASSEPPLPPLKNDQTVDAKIVKNLPQNRADLLIMGRKVTVEPHIPLKTGEILRLQPAETGSGQVLQLVDDTPRPFYERTPVSFKPVESRAFSGTPLPDLKPGQVLEAAILKKLPGNRLSLLVMDKKITAETFVPLKEGATVKLQVAGTGPNQVLHLTDETPAVFYEKPLAALKTLGRPGPFTPLMDLIAESLPEGNMLPDPLHHPGGKTVDNGGDKALREIVRQMLGQLALDPDHVDPEALKNMIRRSGMIWEDKIHKNLTTPDASSGPSAPGPELESNDLKARIMSLIKEAPDETSRTVQSLKSFVENMENLQMVNSQSGADSGKYLMPLPFLFGGSFHFGQLFIDTNHPGGRKKGTCERVMSVALLLDMSNLGQVRADFSIFKKAVSGEFQVESPRIRDFIVNQLPALVEHLEKNGYTVRKAGCRVVDPMTLKNTSLTEKIDSDKNGMLNVVI